MANTTFTGPVRSEGGFQVVSKNATTDGVVLAPSAFSKTFACEPSMIATHEFVVPRSIPIILLIILILCFRLLGIWVFFICLQELI